MIRPPTEMLGNPRFSPSRGTSGKRVYREHPNGTLYAPTSAKTGTIAKLDFEFATRAAQEHLCSGCGLSLDGRVRVFMQDKGSEPPLHAACAAYALVACPHLVREMTDVYLATATHVSYTIDDPKIQETGEIIDNKERASFAPAGRQTCPTIEIFLKHANTLNTMDADNAIDVIIQAIAEDIFESEASALIANQSLVLSSQKTSFLLNPQDTRS